MRGDFNRRLKLEFYGRKITSDAGLLAYGELDEVLGLTDLAIAALSDLLRGKNRRHRLTGLGSVREILVRTRLTPIDRHLTET